MHSPLNLFLLLIALGCATACASLVWWLMRLRKRATLLSTLLARNQAVVEGGGEGVFELDEAGIIAYVNPAAVRISGYTQQELVGRSYRGLFGPPTSWQVRDLSRIGYTTNMLNGVGAVITAKDGRRRPVEYRMLPITPLRADNPSEVDLQAARTRSLLVFRDLTDRSRLDVMLADMQHMAKVGAWELDVGSWRLKVSEGISRRLQIATQTKVHVKRLLPGFTSEARVQLFDAMRKAVQRGQGFELELKMQLGNRGLPHQVEWLRVMGRAERVDGMTLRLYGAVQDVTDRKRAEQLVWQTSQFFGATLDALPASVLYLNQDEQVEYYNNSPLSDWLGVNAAGGERPLQETFGAHFVELAGGIRRALQGHASQMLRGFRKADTVRQIQCSFVPQLATSERMAGCWVVLSDVTEMKTLEARLYQAEKMHAVGQLTGGLAHDFNNLLGVILGNLQLLERDLRGNEAEQRKLAAAVRAALRGSELTRRLLTFARRQPMEPQSVDPNAEITGLSELLRQTLGEASHLRLDLAPGCYPVRVDVGQLEDALLNLTINARDAMPHGGTLTLSTRNVRPGADFFAQHPDLHPGEFVHICVADTGQGIPPQVLNRIFEPFFTTKEVGKGSGLGLAMVHGFVKQLGGTVSVHSDLGQGTKICLFLPRDLSHQTQAPHPQFGIPVQGGHETILVVEDDTDLRATTSLALQGLGYQVLEASSGEAALAIMNQAQRIDALFADVIMPAGMLGTELAQRARQIDPDIRVLLTTGYLDDPQVTTTGKLNNEPVLPKPYVNQVLAQRIRELLD